MKCLTRSLVDELEIRVHGVVCDRLVGEVYSAVCRFVRVGDVTHAKYEVRDAVQADAPEVSGHECTYWGST